jgi:hypothetical protein
MSEKAGIPARQYDNESDFETGLIDGRKGGKSVMITKYLGNNQTVRIPPEIRGLPVTYIVEYAFSEKNIISVTIPGSVTRICQFAFSYNKLTSVKISDGVTEIGEEAFSEGPGTYTRTNKDSEIWTKQ